MNINEKMEQGVIIFAVSSALVILALLLYLIWNTQRIPVSCRENNKNREIVLNGMIVKKIWNSKDHSFEKIILEKHQLFTWNEGAYNYINKHLYDQFKVGDLLIKEKGKLEFLIVRELDTLIIDFELSCSEFAK